MCVCLNHTSVDRRGREKKSSVVLRCRRRPLARCTQNRVTFPFSNEFFFFNQFYLLRMIFNCFSYSMNNITAQEVVWEVVVGEEEDHSG